MTESPLDEQRRRVRRDPASLLFAQLGEAYRRAGRFDEAIEVCRAGLAFHPRYFSAMVTLGRALAATGALDAARRELERVVEAAPDHLSGLRALAEVYHRTGRLDEALARYRAAALLSPGDQDVSQRIRELMAQRTPKSARWTESSRPKPGEASNARGLRTVAALERFLAALHGIRARRRA